MFELTKEEFDEWRSQNGTSNAGDRMGLRYAPYAFTEQGVAQLSTVLSSPRAIAVNIQIIRLFTRMRKALVNHKDLLLQLEKLRHTSKEHSGKIAVIFKYLKQMEQRQQETELLEEIRRRKAKNPIGFKAAKDRRGKK